MGALRVLWRPVAVLVLLLGVLGMHAVGGAGHEAEHASPQPVVTPDVVAHSMSTAIEDAVRQVRTIAESGPRTPLDAAVAVALCLAVLVAGAVLLGRLTRDPSRVEDGRRAVRVRVSTARRGRGPPRSLLAELCVLRT